MFSIYLYIHMSVSMKHLIRGNTCFWVFTKITTFSTKYKLVLVSLFLCWLQVMDSNVKPCVGDYLFLDIVMWIFHTCFSKGMSSLCLGWRNPSSKWIWEKLCNLKITSSATAGETADMMLEEFHTPLWIFFSESSRKTIFDRVNKEHSDPRHKIHLPI